MDRNDPPSNTNADTPSVLGAVVGTAAAIGSKAAIRGIRLVGEAVGVDAEHKGVGDVLRDVRVAVERPETRAAIRDASAIAATAFEAARPGIERMVEQVEHTTLDMGKRAIVVGQNLLSEVPIVGPVLEFPIMISNIVRAGQKVIESGATLTGIGADTLLTIQERIREERAKLAATITAAGDDFP